MLAFFKFGFWVLLAYFCFVLRRIIKREVMLNYNNNKKCIVSLRFRTYHYANLTSRQSCRSTILLSRYVIVADYSLLFFFGVGRVIAFALERLWDKNEKVRKLEPGNYSISSLVYLYDIGERNSSTAEVLLLLLLWCKFEIPWIFPTPPEILHTGGVSSPRQSRSSIFR